MSDTKLSERTVGAPRLQFSLRRLLAFIGAAAVLLGLWRFIGTWAVPAAVCALLAFFIPRRPRWFYIWLLPAVWTTVAWANFSHPGDEYGGFAAGSLAGLWIVILFDVGGSPGDMLPLILCAGAATVAVAGLVLDKLRAPFIPWAAIVVVVAPVLCLWQLSGFETLERAISKNGSIESYVLPAINLALYAATFVVAIGTGVFRLAHVLRKYFGAEKLDSKEIVLTK
jgi:hypothetical protein